MPAAETVTPPPRVGLIRRLLQRWTGTPATPQSSAAAVPTPVPAAAILPPIPPLRPGSTGPITAAEILRFLNDQEVRATYRAVGDVLGVIPQSVGSRLGSKWPEASWVVSAATGDPSGYSRAERHPALYRRSTIITSGAELRTRIAAWRARRTQ